MKLVVKWFKKTDMRSVHKLINSHSPKMAYVVGESFYRSTNQLINFLNLKTRVYYIRSISIKYSISLFLIPIFHLSILLPIIIFHPHPNQFSYVNIIANLDAWRHRLTCVREEGGRGGS